VWTCVDLERKCRDLVLEAEEPHNTLGVLHYIVFGDWYNSHKLKLHET
jgi:hypothetical protein